MSVGGCKSEGHDISCDHHAIYRGRIWHELGWDLLRLIISLLVIINAQHSSPLQILIFFYSFLKNIKSSKNSKNFFVFLNLSYHVLLNCIEKVFFRIVWMLRRLLWFRQPFFHQRILGLFSWNPVLGISIIFCFVGISSAWGCRLRTCRQVKTQYQCLLDNT